MGSPPLIRTTYSPPIPPERILLPSGFFYVQGHLLSTQKTTKYPVFSYMLLDTDLQSVVKNKFSKMGE